MRCKECNGMMVEKLVVIYRVPARQDGESWAGYGLPFDADRYYVDTESDGFECNKCGHMHGY